MKTQTKKLTSSALMIALASVLSVFAVVQMPNGGSVTFASMAPIIILALYYDARWAMFTSVAYAIVQFMLEPAVPPVQTFWSFLLVILLDYVIAFGVLGFSGQIAKFFKNKVVGACAATVIVSLLRLVCHIVSGIVIWNVYAPADQPVWLYSTIYNGSFMIPEMIVCALVVAVLVRQVDFERLLSARAASAQ